MTSLNLRWLTKPMATVILITPCWVKESPQTCQLWTTWYLKPQQISNSSSFNVQLLEPWKLIQSIKTIIMAVSLHKNFKIYFFKCRWLKIRILKRLINKKVCRRFLKEKIKIKPFSNIKDSKINCIHMLSNKIWLQMVMLPISFKSFYCR